MLAFKPLPPDATAAAVEELLKANFCLMERGASTLHFWPRQKIEGTKNAIAIQLIHTDLAPRPTGTNR